MHEMRGMRRSGFILVIVLGLLGVLAYLSLTFAQQAGTTRRLSQHSLHHSKARLAARSGLEKSLMALWDCEWNSLAPTLFERRLESAGDDRNRDGVDSGGEDLAGDGFTLVNRLEQDLTPSLALAEDPQATPTRALAIPMDGAPSGVSWVDDRLSVEVAAKVAIEPGCLDLNGGIEAGEGSEGLRYQADFGVAYSASGLTHPFNERTLHLLNAWGHYYKYRAMVRPDRTYLYTVDRDHPANMMSGVAGAPNGYGNPYGRFDRFDPSCDLIEATILDPITGLPVTVSMEEPLGQRLLSARPGGGFRTLDEPLCILGEYIDQWKDANVVAQPAWTRADGSVIGPVPATLRAEMMGEFRRLARLRPVRRREIVVVPGADIPPMHPNDAAGNVFKASYFERPEGRSHLNARFYGVPSVANDVNRAPLSVLTALIHAVRGVNYREYWPNTRDGTTDFCRGKVLAAPKENSHPVDPVLGNALYSMTDSLRLAQFIDARRRAAPLANLKELGDAIRSWEGSYDGRGQVHDSRTMASAWFPEYLDAFMGNARGHVLAYLLNPHVNSNHLVWDEAQVPSWNQGILSLGRSLAPEYGYRDFSFKNIFDKFMPHKVGGSLGVGLEHQGIEVLGYSLGGRGEILGSSRIKVEIQTHRILDVHVQKDWVAASTQPGTSASTLGAFWVTYPELPGVPPADWDGQLALRPFSANSPQYGENKMLTVSLNAYESNPTATDPAGAWPVGPRSLLGPAADPARGRLMNSLQPAPGQPPRSLVAASYSQIEAASDLLPGGGIRVSPFHNTLSIADNGSGGNHTNRREALLVLRNVLTDLGDDGPGENIDLTGYQRILPSFHEGAVSFYFKPRFTCSKEAGLVSSGNRTLLTIPFVIKDVETEEACTNLSITGFDPYPSSYYTALLRLCWGAVENPEPGRLSSMPSTWPWVQGFRAFPGQGGSGPHLFPNMAGIADMNGEEGYVMQRLMPGALNGMFNLGNIWTPSGDGHSWHWSSPNPFAEERLQAEFIITKYADVPHDPGALPGQVCLDNLNPTFYPSSSNPVTGFGGLDEMSLTAVSGAYVMPATTPLHLFDSSDENSETFGYHTVRKTFILCHPFNTTPGAQFGVGPRSRAGDHQALVAPGRWNHIVLAWRNLYDLLSASDPNQGGCLAVYINGTFRKTSPLEYSMGGLFAQQDFSELYDMPTGVGPASPWFPNKHVPYQAGFAYFSGLYPNMYYGLPQRFGSNDEWAETLHQQVPSLHYLTPNGNFIHHYDYCRYSLREYSARNEDLYMRFPPRFYFGFVPFTQRVRTSTGALEEDAAYAVGSLCWGAFMDIKIFDRPAPAICDPSGGFLEELPNWDAFSPYANNTASSPLILHPLNLMEKDLGIGKWRVAGVSWNAHLPEYHEFWDDQDASVAGPNSDDCQHLLARIFVGNVQLGTLLASQDPLDSPIDRWEPAAPPIVLQPGDLRVELVFQGPRVTMSTPIIESLELALRYGEPRFHDYISELE